jgi:hypothetical protein
MTGSKRRVFISYARTDSAYAEVVARALGHAGRSVWSDREIRAGEDWDFEIQKALRDASVVVLIVSADSLASQ